MGASSDGLFLLFAPLICSPHSSRERLVFNFSASSSQRLLTRLVAPSFVFAVSSAAFPFRVKLSREAGRAEPKLYSGLCVPV